MFLHNPTTSPQPHPPQFIIPPFGIFLNSTSHDVFVKLSHKGDTAEITKLTIKLKCFPETSLKNREHTSVLVRAYVKLCNMLMAQNQKAIKYHNYCKSYLYISNPYAI